MGKMTFRHLLTWCATAAGLLYAVPASAQAGAAAKDTGAKAAGSDADRVIQSFSIPESPAFVFLSASPAQVTRPTTARELAVGLINAIDEDGHVRQGVALEFQPSRFFAPITQATYRRRGLAYILTNAQLSIGTVRVAGDTSVTDLAIGLRLMLYDGGDPLADKKGFADPLANGMLGCLTGDEAPPTLPGRLGDTTRVRQPAPSEQDLACLATVRDSIVTAYAKAHWNAPRVGVAYAHGERLTDQLISQGRGLGNRIWAVAGYPLQQWGQVLGYLQYSSTRLVPDSAATKLLTYGIRAVGGSPTTNGFLELLTESRTGGAEVGDKTTVAWTGGIEFKVGAQLWLSTGIGHDQRLAQGGGPNVVLANLRWGLSDRARFGR